MITPPCLSIRQTNTTAVRARHVGSQPNHDHPRRPTGEGFAGISHASAGIARALNAVGKIQLAAVICKACLRRLFDEQVAEGLVEAIIVLVPNPECVGIELHTLSGHPAKEHGTETAVADWVGLLFPVACGLLTPEHAIRPDCLQFRIRIGYRTERSKAQNREGYP